MLKRQILLKPSRVFFILMFFIILGALLSIFCSYLPYYIQLLLAALVLGYGGRLLWIDVGLRAPQSIVSLTWEDSGTWLIRERSGKEYPAQLCADSRIMPGFVILRFKQRSVVLFNDAIQRDDYRQMLMRLRTYALIGNAKNS